MTNAVTRLRAALADRYTIERELGRGGMATVYLARDVKHDRPVALKVLRPEVAAALGAERFLREIRVTARLHHPHILTLIDSGAADGFLYYAMPYVEGASLRQRLTREGQLPLDDAIRITRAVASALDFAHGHGVIHRDVKPENILLHQGEPMLADFGIASAAGGDRLTETGLSVGTPAYMSPEQSAAEATLDGRTDQYSLASVLYEMLAGEPPYPGSTARAVIAKRLVDPVPTVRRLRATVPPGVEHALTKALAKAPADRWASLRAFSDALTAPGRPRLPSVAVLPFLNLSADPENEYFADGITEDVIAHLSKIRALKVISRTSVMAFKQRGQSVKEIGARLEAATLLDGSVRRVGDRVRIVAQLMDAETERHLWAETYDRRLTDVFAIQTDVALHIASALRAELTPDEKSRLHKEPTNDLQAYQLYLQGRHCYTRYTEEGTRKGLEYFEQAIAKDPEYALAYAAVAMVYTELGEAGTLRPDEAYARARAASARALALDDGLGEAHCMLAFLKAVCDFDWVGAEEEFKRALALTPNSADTYDLYGRMCLALERNDEALAMEQRAQELDPLAHRADVARALLRAGRYDEAMHAARRSLEFDPLYARGHATLGWAYLKQGMNALGVGELEQAVALSSGDTLWLAQLGQAYGLVGQGGRARDVLRQLEELSRDRFVSPYHMAIVHTGLGEQERAIDWLEQAYEGRSGPVYSIKGSFLFTPLRGHPRFVALLAKMNLA